MSEVSIITLSNKEGVKHQFVSPFKCFETMKNKKLEKFVREFFKENDEPFMSVSPLSYIKEETDNFGFFGTFEV